MTDQPWWRSAVVYQIYPRSFADGDGDGIGDLRGALEHLDHLADLGVDVVWLSPVYRSPMDDNGYDISDYEDVDPLFGTLEDLDALVAGLHERGIRLVMDLVVNHTSDEHAWFEESRSSRTNPKADWYVWRDPRPGHVGGEPGAEPTNWESFFSGPAWTWVPEREQYYLHLFSTKQPDLNWEDAEVRDAVFAMMRRWLDRGVDGFRMDVVNLISKDQAFPDGEVGPSGYGDGSPYYVHGPRLREHLAAMQAEVFAARPGTYLTVGEMPMVTTEQAAALTDREDGVVSMVFQFEHMDLDAGATKWDPVPLHLPDLKGSLARWQDALGERGWNSLYWDNHDQARAVSRFGDDRAWWRESATLLATVLHLHRGTPYVYQGEEIGMTNAPFAVLEDYRDIESLQHHRAALGRGEDPEAVLAALLHRSRDHARTPVQWTADPATAGFTTGEAWIGVNPNTTWLNVAAQRDDPGSVLAHHRRLIALRHAEPCVVEGDFALLHPDHERLWAFTRQLTADGTTTRLSVWANLSGEPLAVTLEPEDAAAELVLGNHPDVPEPVTGDGAPGSTVVLRPWEARVLRSSR